MKKKKAKFIIGGSIVIMAIAYLAYAGMRDTNVLVYYNTPTELLAKGKTAYNNGIRISGRIEDGSINWDTGKLDLSFRITDGKNTIPVTYHGIVPDTFKYGVDVIIEGKLNVDDTFQATELLAKCPSKYDVEDE